MSGNGSLVPPELKWLYREIWIWRAGALLMILFFAGIEIVKWKQLTDHNRETRVYEARVLINQDRIMGMLQKNWDAVQKNDDSIATVDEHLRQCSGCHSHPREPEPTGWLRRR